MQETGGRRLRIGIGFATGRKSFRKVLNSYLYNWREHPSDYPGGVSLNLFVAYDLDYSNTQSTDYTNLSQDIVDMMDETFFIGKRAVQREIDELAEQGVLTREEALLIFGSGYAGKRNSILYMAIQKHMDYLLFLDDDEYPVAVTNSKSGTLLWGGQHIISAHLNAIGQADVTNGLHCGYISPIPQIDYSPPLTEEVFKNFIGALSNDVLNWESMCGIMRNGGVTYAQTAVLTDSHTKEVKEQNRCKFITGSNLCFNLTRPERTFPFYNPPGARGEDTFLSTLLCRRTVLKIPYYTFHDGFGAYQHLLDGVLPTRLESPCMDNGTAAGKTVTRLINACIGWVRYKPLLLYLTAPGSFQEDIRAMRSVLSETLPALCEYFKRPEFMKLLPELDRYVRNMEKHKRQFDQAQNSWEKIIIYLT